MASIALLSHPLYSVVDDISSIRIFMENHVFSVWLFMCLLDTLIHRCTGSVFWRPPSDYTILHVLRDIMYEEELDVFYDTRTNTTTHMSHLDVYIRGMDEIGASTADIKRTLSVLGHDGGLNQSFVRSLSSISDNTKDYIFSHLALISPSTPFSSLYSYFTYGRELLIPHMFQKILDHVSPHRALYPTFIHYLERHVELDVVHGALLQNAFPEKDDAYIQLAYSDRLHLWDGIHNDIVSSSASSEHLFPHVG